MAPSSSNTNNNNLDTNNSNNQNGGSSSSNNSTIEARPQTKPAEKEEKCKSILEEMVPTIDVFIDEEVSKLTANCRIFSNGQDNGTPDGREIPVFTRKEVMTSHMLGNGAFSEVYQVYGFRLNGDDNDGDDDGMDCASSTASPVRQEAREELSRTALNTQGHC